MLRCLSSSDLRGQLPGRSDTRSNTGSTSMLLSLSASELSGRHNERLNKQMKPPLLLKALPVASTLLGGQEKAKRMENNSRLKMFFVDSVTGQEPVTDFTEMSTLHAAITEVEVKGSDATLVDDNQLMRAKKKLKTSITSILKKQLVEASVQKKNVRTESCKDLSEKLAAAPPLPKEFTAAARKIKAEVELLADRDEVERIRRHVTDQVKAHNEAIVYGVKHPNMPELPARRFAVDVGQCAALLKLYNRNKKDAELCSTVCKIGMMWAMRNSQLGDELDTTQLQDRRLLLLQRGYAVIAADSLRAHGDDPLIGARCSRYSTALLGLLSATLLFETASGMLHSEKACQGALRAFVQVAKDGQVGIDKLALIGCRELINEYKKRYCADRTLDLQIFSLQRMLSKSKHKSVKILQHVSQLDSDDLQTIKKYFDKMGPDVNGAVPFTKLANLFRSLGMKVSTEEMDEIIAVMDTDGGGTMQFNEFLFLVESRGGVRNFSVESQFQEHKLNDLRLTFDRFDADGSGEIDNNELGLALKELGLSPTEQELTRMIKEFDADKSGTLDWYEFLYIMASLMGEDDTTDLFKLAFNMFKGQGGLIHVKSFTRRIVKMTRGELTYNDIAAMVSVVKKHSKSPNQRILNFKEFMSLLGNGDEIE